MIQVTQILVHRYLSVGLVCIYGSIKEKLVKLYKLVKIDGIRSSHLCD